MSDAERLDSHQGQAGAKAHDPSTLRVLFMAPFGEHGGSEMLLLRVMRDLPRHIDRRALLLGQGPLEDMLTGAGIDVAVEPMPGKAGVLRFPAAARRWAGRLEGEQIDVIHANQAKAALFALPLARRLGVPVLWMKHDHVFDGRPALWLGRRCDHVAVVSDAMAGQFTHELGTRVSVIYPGVRIPASTPVRSTGPMIAMAGRLDPLKGFGSVIRGARLLRDRGHDVRVQLAGVVDRVHPEHAVELAALVSELGLGDHVAIGPSNDMSEHYEQARVFVLPSPPRPGGLPSEGAPTSLMEAMAHQTAVVAARQPGTEEVVGPAGVVVDDFSPLGWANALEPFITDPEMADRMGHAARQRAQERFSIARTVGQLEQLYVGLAASGRLPRRWDGVVRAGTTA